MYLIILMPPSGPPAVASVDTLEAVVDQVSTALTFPDIRLEHFSVYEVERMVNLQPQPLVRVVPAVVPEVVPEQDDAPALDKHVRRRALAAGKAMRRPNVPAVASEHTPFTSGTDAAETPP